MVSYIVSSPLYFFIRGNMAEVMFEDTMTFLNRVCQELNLRLEETSQFIKITGSTGHRVYVQKSKVLRRIDTTLPKDLLSAEDIVSLKEPLGAITCHIAPSIDALERVLKTLPTAAKLVSTKNRPFEVKPRKVKPLMQPLAVVSAPPPQQNEEQITLSERVKKIKEAALQARIKMSLADPDKYGKLSEVEARDLVNRQRMGLVTKEQENSSALESNDHDLATRDGLNAARLEYGLELTTQD